MPQYIDKNHLSKDSPQSSSLGQMGNQGLIVALNYASLYLRICPKDFFSKLCSMIWHNK